MKVDLSRFRETFVEEAREHVAEFEAGLLELQQAEASAQLLDGLFRAVHSIKGSSGMFGFTDVGSFSHSVEGVLSRLRDGRLPVTAGTVELLLRCSDVLGQLIEAADQGQGAPAEKAELEAGLAALVAGASSAAEETAGGEPAGASARAVTGDGASRRSGTEGVRSVSGGSIRVATMKVDELVNLAGELAISQSVAARAASAVEGTAAAPLLEALETVSRNVRDLQERVLAVRMLPVERLFARLPRLVHDVAAACGKTVELRTTGGDTELDRSVIERLSDPLTHLIRNAIDHGVETPADRRARGKPEVGVVSLSAWHEGGNVMIEIADDGRGLDREAILARGIEMELVRPDDALTDGQVYRLIFEPGLSTAGEVTDVSGRGIGADVVRRNVEALNGTVSVSSTPGSGTRFLLKLPLTLALLDGLQLRVGEQRYVVPLLTMVECFRPAPDQIHRVAGGYRLLRVREDTLPLLRLDDLLAVEAPGEGDDGVVVIMSHEGFRFGVLVDELLEPAQVVVKSLEANYRRVDGILGATILGDGSVSLILDVGGLTRLARRVRANANANPLPPATTAGA